MRSICWVKITDRTTVYGVGFFLSFQKIEREIEAMGIVRIALIGLSTLETIGVRSVLENIGAVNVETFQDLMDYASSSVSADGFIVSKEVFLSDIDFFLPRRQSLLILSSSATVLPMNLPIMADEVTITECLQNFLDSTGERVEKGGALSQREKEVLKLLVAGKINKEIADELCISVNTVITHRKNITSKTGIKSLSGLSLYALLNGIS